MTNLMQASNNWAERPADERFWTLPEMGRVCDAIREDSIERAVAFSALRAEAGPRGVQLVGPAGNPAALTHHSFGQVAAIAGAPSQYLRGLPPEVAALCLNTGLQARTADAPRSALLHMGEGNALTMRALTSQSYDRVWDAEVCTALDQLHGWMPPAGRAPAGYKGPTRAATRDDILPGQINIEVGSDIAPSGLYASDHDMFAFLVAPDRVISDGEGGSLMRGIFVRNSEVGDASLSVTFFLMQAVCGNHIVWNATGVHEIRVRHRGSDTFGRAFRGLRAELVRYADTASSNEEAAIASARTTILGATKEETLDAIVKYAKTHSMLLSRGTVTAAYEATEERPHWGFGNPRSVWGMVAGLTYVSQQSGMADERDVIDRAAGKLMAEYVGGNSGRRGRAPQLAAPDMAHVPPALVDNMPF